MVDRCGCHHQISMSSKSQFSLQLTGRATVMQQVTNFNLNYCIHNCACRCVCVINVLIISMYYRITVRNNMSMAKPKPFRDRLVISTMEEALAEKSESVISVVIAIEPPASRRLNHSLYHTNLPNTRRGLTMK